MGMVFGLNVGLSGRTGRCRLQKSPSRETLATLEPAYLTRLKETVVTVKFGLKGSGKRRPFLAGHSTPKPAQAPRPEDTRQTQSLKEATPRPQPPVSAAAGRRVLFIRCRRHRIETCKAFKALENPCTSQTFPSTPRYKMKIPKLKFKYMSMKYSYHANSLNCLTWYL